MMGSLALRPIEKVSITKLDTEKYHDEDEANIFEDDQVTVDYNNFSDDDTVDFDDDDDDDETVDCDNDFDFDEEYYDIGNIYVALDEVMYKLGDFVVEITANADNECDISGIGDGWPSYIEHDGNHVAIANQRDIQQEKQNNINFNKRDKQDSFSSNVETGEESSKGRSCLSSSADISYNNSSNDNSEYDDNIDELSILSDDIRPYGEALEKR